MKQTIICAAGLISAVTARPGVNTYSFAKREVPQEHAHRNVNLIVNDLIQLNNPNNVGDAIFGLLGAKAAAEGAGKIADPDCLQLAIADQAFTNAKEAGDVNGMTFALIYRALERNTGSVGLASVPCESIKAVNPEIAALQQHQDPAGEGAQALNKQIAQELAAQIAAVGGDPLLANEASTFAPGQIGDPTAKGNTCDDDKDDAGCINTLKLRVDDLTQDEILAAAGGAGGAVGAGANATAGAAAGNATADAGAAANQGNGKAKGKGKMGKKGKGKGKAKGQANAAKDAAASGGACNAAAGAGAGAGNAAAGADNAAAGASAGNATAGADNAAAGAGAGNAAAGAAAGAGADNAAAASGAADFGSCSNPAIKFGTPSDGRKEDAFEAADLKSFPHGSALNIKVISSFICDQLVNACKANQAAVDKCKQAEAASDGLKAQAAADAFNNAIGA